MKNYIAGKARAFAKTVKESDKEVIRRRIVTVIFIIYYLLIFEGALRKWAFPSYNKIIYFIRDPFVLYVYYLVIRHKMWPKWSPPFVFGCGVAVFFIVLALMQGVTTGNSPMVAAIGWRGYFWYVPLAFIIGEQFRGKDLARLVKHTLLLAIPIAGLVFWQFKAGPYAWINKTFDDETKAFVLIRDIVRTSGTFTFSAGQVMFIGSIISMCLTCWLLPARDRPLGRIFLWLSTFAVLVNLYVAGSRSAFFAAAFCLMAAIFSGVVMTNRTQQLRALLLPGMIAITGAILYMTVFTSAFEAMKERQETAVANEGSTLARAFHILTSVLDTLPRSTLIGYGIGMGSNAGAVLAAGTRRFMLSEHELPRIVDEAGVPGLLYIGFRVWLFVWLLWGSIIATRRSNNPLPLLLFSFDGVTLLVGQITLQGTINGYGWLFAGFCMAANKLGAPTSAPAPMITKRKRPRLKQTA